MTIEEEWNERGMREEIFLLPAAYHVITKEVEIFRNSTFSHMVNSFFDKVGKLCFCADNIAISDGQIASFTYFYCCMRYRKGKNWVTKKMGIKRLNSIKWINAIQLNARILKIFLCRSTCCKKRWPVVSG